MPEPALTTCTSRPRPARGIVVVNSPGANSISVAELAMAQILALARKLPRRRRLDEARRLGQEKLHGGGDSRQGSGARRPGPHRPGRGRRARAFEMMVIAHDPFVAPRCRGARDCHGVARQSVRRGGLPVAPSAVDGERGTSSTPIGWPGARRDPHRQHRARRPDRRRRARVAAIQTGHVGGAALDTKRSRRRTRRCRSCRRSWPVRILPRPPARARSWSADTISTLRDFLKDGTIRNSVNFPPTPR